MNIKKIIKKIIYSTNVSLFIFVKIKRLLINPVSQSNEGQVLDELVKKYKINKNYLEIGFSPWEYNCSTISDKNEGIIIDANKENIKIGGWIIKKAKLICEFIDLDNIEKILKKINLNINILSLDIDGNDFYIMEKLIKLNPSLIICEYNPAYALRPITSIYKKNFDRTKEDKDWLYYGCSIKAWEILMKKNEYSMIAISDSRVNVFFIKNNLIIDKSEIITPEDDFVDYDWPEEMGNGVDMWNKIKHKQYKLIN